MDATQDDLPFDLPAPRALADALLSRAWDDDVADRERLLLEQAALVITRLLVHVAALTEHSEARRAAQ